MEDMEKNKNNDSGFMRGVLFGILLTVCVALLARSSAVLYRYFVKGEINYETKAKLIYNFLESNYVEDINEKDMYEGIYAGMVYNTTDRYSTYIPADAYKDYLQNTQGEYVGVGIVVGINENSKIEIKYVYEGSSAEKAGIMQGDILVSVEGVEAEYENYQDIVDLIKGEEGTEVNISVYRPQQALNLDMTVKRVHIDTPTVCSAMLEDNIGYIRISQFEGVTYDQFKASFDKLKADGMERIIVDLRDNPGGLLTSVSSILDEFLSEGVITYTEDKNGNREYEYSTGDGIDMPMAVLVNASSASASELFSAAVQDRGIGEVVGVTTYGKGVVQTTYPLSDGSALKITTSRYYTPNGICIDGIGVKPDYEAEAAPDFSMPYLAKDEAEFAENDLQLEKAVEVVKNK